MKLYEGEYYQSRQGLIIGPLKDQGCSHTYQFISEKTNETFTKDGKFHIDGLTPYDLVEHIPITDPEHPHNKKPMRDWWSLSLNDLVLIIDVSPMPE